MDLRLNLLELTARHDLSVDAARKLKHLAGFDEQPPTLLQRLPIGMAVLGAVLGGLGIIFWIAANWESLGRFGRFALLEAIVAVMCIGAWRRPAARVPLSLVAFLACGGLFAYFGQTYQTGADPWQLFAVWAALTLPLCLGVRHDALWTAWSIVAMTAAVLCAHTYGGQWWRNDGSPFARSLGSWIPALLLACALSPAMHRITGAGVWPMRLCMVYATIGLAFTSVTSLFGDAMPAFYVIGLAAMAAMAYAFSQRRLFDLFVVSALALGLNIMLVTGLARLFFRSAHENPIFALLVIGGGAAVMLGASVKLIMSLSREHAGELAQ